MEPMTTTSMLTQEERSDVKLINMMKEKKGTLPSKRNQDKKKIKETTEK